jgi:hypothetical protein
MAKQGDVATDETDRRRGARREDRDRRVAGSEGSDERQYSRRNSILADPAPRTSWWRKLTG